MLRAPKLIDHDGVKVVDGCCSFCGRTQDQTGRLIMGPGVFICQECVGVCAGVFADEQRQARIAPPLVITVHAAIEGGHEDTVRLGIDELKQRLEEAGAQYRVSVLRLSGDGTIHRLSD